MVKDRYLDPYRQSEAQYGSSFEVTLWANETAQKLRFDIFTQMCDLSGKRIVDAGCSRGDLAAYLLDRSVDFESYMGVDGLSDVIAFAEQRNLPRCSFHAGDFLVEPELLSVSNPQVICISGSLNTMTDKQVLTALESAWAATDETLLFNFLPDLARLQAPQQTSPARRLNALRLIRWATGRSGRMVYRQDYFRHGHDATIKMSKS